MAGAEFFASRKAAAVFKHGILSRYPVVFASKTGKGVEGNRVVFLDGYAGRGEYDDGEPGSPLLLSRCAEFVGGYRNVHGFFVEQDRDNYENLVRVLEEKGGTAPRSIRQGALDEHLDEALALSAGASLFIFLDPFGTALDFSRLRGVLLDRPPWPPTELLLHFSVLSVARMGRAVRVAGLRHGDLPDGDRKTAERLSRFLGGEWWQKYFAEVEDENDEVCATEVAMKVGEIYERRLVAGTGFRAVRMPVRPKPDRLPKYVLVLFSAHPEGAWHFADSLGKAGVEWSVAWQSEDERKLEAVGQYSLLLELPGHLTVEGYRNENRQHWVKVIAANISRILAADGPFRPVERVPEVYGATLGLAGAPEVRAAVKLLSGDGRIMNSGKGDFWKEVIRSRFDGPPSFPG